MLLELGEARRKVIDLEDRLRRDLSYLNDYVSYGGHIRGKRKEIEVLFDWVLFELEAVRLVLSEIDKLLMEVEG